MPVRTGYFFVLTLHDIMYYKTLLFNVGYTCPDRFALTLHISSLIDGLKYCKMALFKPDICLYSLCTILDTAKHLYSMLAIPVRTGCLFALTLQIF